MVEQDRRRELLARLVAELKECKREIARAREKIAVIGIACRFPGGEGVAGFWDLLSSGGDAVTRGRPGGLVVNAETEAARSFGAYVARLDRFDAEFFRIAPTEAEFMDPQQRVLLETGWEAIEDAGLDPARLAGSRTGVFVGIGDSNYQRLLAERLPRANLHVITGTSYAVAAGRIAFALGLEGPAVSVDTACSSSLVALHQAVAALQRREADLALAGGVSAVLSARADYLSGAGGMLAPDGRCKTFDAAADGFVRGEGCGLLVLKRLSEAERDGDRIHGVLLGSAVNQDGASAGLTVPNGPAQERVMAAALARAGIEPGSVAYLEAHGTGTELGDPIELRAAAAVYGRERDPARPLRIGSVKTNIGHLEAAAGIAGVVKVLLAMRHGTIPRHLHLETLTPALDWESLPLQVTTEASPWPAEPGRPARAAVSSFGLAGTNAHVILERYGSPGEPRGAAVTVGAATEGGAPAAPEARCVRLLPLSGRTARALSSLADRYLGWLEGDAEGPSWERLSDAAWTAGVGRRHFGERAGLVFSGTAGLREQLIELAGRARAEPAATVAAAGDAPRREGRKVAFLFTGQGSQWSGMGRDLYEREPAARAAFDRGEALFAEAHGASLLEAAFGGDGAGERLERTGWAHPALYALQGALLARWKSLGIAPDVVLGHGAGEVAAAAAAGLFGFDDGMRFAIRRGTLAASLPGAGERTGGMLAVFAPAPVVRAALREANEGASGPPLEPAADNGTHHVLGGPAARLAVLEERLTRDGIRAELLRASDGFHSVLVDPILDDLERAAPPPSGPTGAAALVSSVTGRVAGVAEAGDPGYWRRQARAPVRFADGVRTLAELGVDVLIEIGPRPVLGPLAALGWPGEGDSAPTPVVLASQDGPDPDPEVTFLRAVSGAYEAGLPVSFAGLFAGEPRRRVALPTYPFQRERHWMAVSTRHPIGSGDPLLGVGREIASGGHLFENELDPARDAWLGDCRAFGRSLAPAGLYAALAVAGSRLAGKPWTRLRIEELRIEEQLAWAGDAPGDGAAATGRLVQVQLGAAEGRRGRTFTVFSRAEEREPWVRHVTARVSADRRGSPGAGGEAELSGSAWAWQQSSPAPAATVDIYRRLAARGLRYGPSLRVLDEVRSDGERAVGVVRAPPGAAGDGVAFHPVLLEACFQLVSALNVPGEPDGLAPDERGASAWLPVGWESLWLRAPCPESLECHAWLATAPPAGAGGETQRADLAFFAPGGEAFGGVRGFTLRRTSRPEVVSVAAGMDELLYEVAWRESVGRDARGCWSADFLAAPRAVAYAPRDPAEFFEPGDPAPERFAAVERELEVLARSCALAALERLGWERRVGAPVEPGPLRRRFGIGAEFRGLFARLLRVLGEAGVLEAAEPEAPWRVAGAADAAPVALAEPEALAKRLREDFPEFLVEIALLERCGGALAEVLAGRTDGLQLLFSGEPSATDLYLEAPGYRAVNRVVARVVSDLVAGLPAGRRLRILEVGAGTGGTTRAVLAQVPAARTDYAYTDLSGSFFAAAEKRFRDSTAAISYRALDIERDPALQGCEPHRYDIVLAANVLHATRDLRESLRNCRRLLAPSGVLVALEGMRPRAWSDLTFGLLPGWWRFDDAYRADYALVGPSVWKRALTESGFGETGILGMAGPEEAAGAPAGGDDSPRRNGTAVILARGPARVQPDPGLWVLGPEAVDTDGPAASAGAELERWGQTVVRAGAAAAPLDPARRESWRDLFQRLPETPAFRGVVHLGALDLGRDPSAAEFPEDWKRVNASAEALLGGLRDAGKTPSAGVWFVTSGGQGPADGPSGTPTGAALWGLGRTAVQETAGFGIRMLDLDPAASAPATPLAQELFFPDRELEVAWRDGKRWIPRLVRAPAAAAPPHGAERRGDDAEDWFAPGLVRGDRTYLVSADLGDFGVELADWLRERGGGAVMIYESRRLATAAGAAKRRSIPGREVPVLVGDPSDPAAAFRLLSGIAESGLPPLGGVFLGVDPAAPRSGDVPEADGLPEASLRAVCEAWNLHLATLDRDIDCFVLFSGFGGVVGGPGPPRRAAADAFLHHLARRRRAAGLSGQAIAWGRWLEEGAAAGDGPGEAAWMAPGRGFPILARVLGEGLAPVAAGVVDWGVFGEDRPPPPLVSEWTLAAPGGAGEPAADDLMSRLRAAPGATARERLMTGFLETEVRALLRLPAPPPPDVGFLDLGMDSLMAVELRNRIEDALEGEYRPLNTVVFDHPNIARLAKHLLAELPDVGPAAAAPRLRSLSRAGDGPVALVGVAGRFPGAGDVAAFARGLGAGLDGVRPRRPGLPVPGADGEALPAGYLEGIDRFDAGFFGIPVAEAKLMEPQQRLLLETSWHALEDAGIPPGSLDGTRTGVYAALGAANQEFRYLFARGGTASLGLHDLTGTSAATAVGRIAYLLGLEGPAISVDTSCSSSLVAVHQAILDLERRDTDLALAGGANVILAGGSTHLLTESGLLSATGRCSAFDASADGYVRGEGCGMVVLKRLADAEAAGDRILAVVRGSAVNQDGARSGLSAPAGPGQRRVMEDALRRARLDPSDVDYLEAHGIGSPFGDPIEVNAAAAVYGRGRSASRPLWLGSVKTNVGHLEAAAGVVGVIKAVLAIRSRAIPPQLHFRRPNPRIGWRNLPLRVVTEPTPWAEDSGRPHRAAVSAFGVSGTNAHLILEEQGAATSRLEAVSGAPRLVPVLLPEGITPLPPGEDAPPARPRRLLPLSARSTGALRSLATRYLDRLEPLSEDGGAPDAPLDLGDLAWSAGTGRDHFEHRAALVFAGADDLRNRLREVAARRSRRPPAAPRKVGFLFSGESDSWSAVSRDLYESEPAARAVLRHCDGILTEAGGPSLLEAVVPGSEAPVAVAAAVVTASGTYALEAALLALWSRLGVSPAVVSGSGVGAFAGGYAAGVFGLDEGLQLAALRGLRRGVAGRPGQGILVCDSRSRVRSVVREMVGSAGAADLFLVALGSGRRLVAGPCAAVAALEERLAASGERPERFPPRAAAVTELLRGALGEFRFELAAAAVHDARGGRRIRPGRLRDPAFWERRMMERARSASAPGWPSDPEVDLCIEVGPPPPSGRAAASDAERSAPAGALVASPRPPGGGEAMRHDGGFPDAVAQTYEGGVDIRFDGLFGGERRRRVALPGYPFRRPRYWPAASAPPADGQPAGSGGSEPAGDGPAGCAAPRLSAGSV